MRCVLTAMLLTLGLTATAPAQDRFIVGRKLVAFENAWDSHPDAAARKRTLPPLKRALGHFFGGKFAEAARSLDEARHALESAQPADGAVRWADSLAVIPGARLTEPGLLEARIARIYDPAVAAPGRVEIKLLLDGADGVTRELTKTDVTSTTKLIALPCGQLPDGDHSLRTVFAIDGTEIAGGVQTLSIAKDAKARLQRLRPLAREQLGREPLGVETLTLLAHGERLQRLLDYMSFETNFPAERLLREAEELAKLPKGGTYYDGKRPGQFWLTLPIRGGKHAPIRIDVPPEAKASKPIPLVIALHGMGGSENLFFDAYGHGEIVRQARRRGWMVVATRADGLFAAPPVVDVIDELSRRYPIDKSRVFLVGHSMGAAQAVSLAKLHPERWAGVACLGGGAAIKVSDPLKKVPFYIGAGTEDFLLAGCRGLAKALKDSGVETVKMHEFPEVEHITIVQVALPEVFEWFESLPRAR